MSLSPDIPPDLAKRGLDADARNTLAKVAGGDTLPAGKRQLFLPALLAASSPEEVTQARIYAILQRYTEGKRLTKDELAEIAHLLPPEQAAASFKVFRPYLKYLKSYKEYVPVYGKAVRTIKWWVEQGEKAPQTPTGPDLPPLDNPVEMPVWWDRVMKQCCPQSVIDAARAAAAAPTTLADNQPSLAPHKASAPPTVPARFEAPAVTTQEQNLQHLKEQLARVRHELLEAQHEQPPDQSRIEAKERKWRELRNEVDKAEEAVFKMRSKQGKMIDVEQLGSELLPMLVTVANAVRSVRTRLKSRLAAAKSEDEEETLWQNGIDECFAELIAGGFVTREQLALAA